MTVHVYTYTTPRELLWAGDLSVVPERGDTIGLGNDVDDTSSEHVVSRRYIYTEPEPHCVLLVTPA